MELLMRYFTFFLFVLGFLNFKCIFYSHDILNLNWTHYQLLSCQNWLLAAVLDSTDPYIEML